MDLKIREAQKEILNLFGKKSGSFAMSGGTALELYYLNHRFSVDLDFFSPSYNSAEINALISEFRKYNESIKLETELKISGQARVSFYTIPIRGTRRALKIDFIEDVLLKKPNIKKFDGIAVYSVEDIYFQKLSAIGGARVFEDAIGRQVIEGGRREVRDVYDIYMLSKKIRPLSVILKNMPSYLQKGIVQWYQTFSRQEVKIGLLDLDIYDKTIGGREMIAYLEKEIKEFIRGLL